MLRFRAFVFVPQWDETKTFWKEGEGWGEEEEKLLFFFFFFSWVVVVEEGQPHAVQMPTPQGWGVSPLPTASHFQPVLL